MKNIAIFCGSFSPFTIGHLNILEKSEKIFGKGNVIVSVGVNPNKVDQSFREKYLKNIDKKCNELSLRIDRKVEHYSGFLHDYIYSLERKGYNVVVIRGLRNGDDLDYEINQLRFINDFKKDVNVIFIPCDKEYEHISSSAIRKIEEFGGNIEKYIV